MMIAVPRRTGQALQGERGAVMPLVEKGKKAKEDLLVAPSHPPSPDEQRLSPKAYVPKETSARVVTPLWTLQL